VSIISPFLMVFMAAAIYVAIWLQHRRENLRSQSSTHGKPAVLVDSGRGNRGLWALLVLAVALMLLVSAIAVLVFMSYFAAERARRAEAAARLAQAQEAERVWQQQLSRNDLAWLTGWTMTDEGPALSENVVRFLNLSDAQVEQVNAALRDASRKGREIELRNTTRERNERGRLVTVVSPSLVEVEMLENELWSTLDTVLNAEQQRVARANLKFRPLDAVPGVTLNTLVAPGLFGYSETGARIETWRVGTWHHWNITVRGYTLEQNAPEAPPLYRRYWEEPSEPAAPPTESP
jgi:type II secretory pathway pseudopilin PulG